MLGEPKLYNMQNNQRKNDSGINRLFFINTSLSNTAAAFNENTQKKNTSVFHKQLPTHRSSLKLRMDGSSSSKTA